MEIFVWDCNQNTSLISTEIVIPVNCSYQATTQPPNKIASVFSRVDTGGLSHGRVYTIFSQPKHQTNWSQLLAISEKQLALGTRLLARFILPPFVLAWK